MSDTQVLTVVLATTPTFTIVLVGILLNNARLNDLRDLLRAEMATLRVEMAKNQSEMLARFGELDARLTRLEARFGT